MPTIKFVKGKYNNADAIDKLISYIFNSQKTTHNITGVTSAFPLEKYKIIQQFNKVQIYHRNAKGRKAYHLIVSFSEKEEALFRLKDYRKIGYKIAAYFDNAHHQTAFALHENTDNLHIHFAINAVNYITGKKYHMQRNDYRHVKIHVQRVIKRMLKHRLKAVQKRHIE